MKNFKCPDCGADLLDWRHFNDAIMKTPDEYDFECTARTCGKRYQREEILQKQEE